MGKKLIGAMLGGVMLLIIMLVGIMTLNHIKREQEMSVPMIVQEVESVKKIQGEVEEIKEIKEIEEVSYEVEKNLMTQPTLQENQVTSEMQPEVHKVLEGVIICIDPGHQAKGNSEKESIGPGSQVTKAKVSSGTRGVSTKKYEYELNLEVALKLRDTLEEKGAVVYMTREQHDIEMSNKERAEFANEKNAILYSCAWNRVCGRGYCYCKSSVGSDDG